jgi:signal transduction histidine kinase/DNA-binding response OmpR family regulator
MKYQPVTSLAPVLVVSTIAAFPVLLLAYVRQRRRYLNLVEQMKQAVKLNLEQSQAIQRRHHLDSVKDEFISTVSHELRTPLTSIRGALGLLSTSSLGPVDPKARNLLRIATNNTDRLVRLINDILDLERMDSGRAPLQISRCVLRDLCIQAVETMSAMAEAADVWLDILPEPEPLAFEGDPDRILQVLFNLLSNAIKFSPRGAAVTISTEADGDHLQLRVADRGRGIPADKLDAVFDRFLLIDAVDSRQKGGTGLGLAICRSIATQHGGAIWAERNSAESPGIPGSTFVFRIPRLPADSFPAAPAHIDQPCGTVLVCDDDATIRRIVADQLRIHGYTVLEAGSGEQAIQFAARQPLDAILLDLYMPGMSGWETLERLKRQPETADIPIVVCSVLSPATRSISGSLAASAQGWVQKPFNESLLLAEVGRVLHTGGGPGHILLVEDDIDLATVVMSSFESQAAEDKIAIEHARTLHDAKQACTLSPPDILILDLTLPDGSGFSLVDWLRQQPGLRTLPMVVYSGRSLSPREMEQLRLGPTQFLAKARVQPREVEQLVLAMVRHLQTSEVETSAA